MKKVFVFAIMILLIASSIPAVAQAKAQKASAAPEKTLFQIASDSITEVHVSGGSKEVNVFNDAKAGLMTIDNASAKAKPLSLRDNKGELQRRRMGMSCM